MQAVIILIVVYCIGTVLGNCPDNETTTDEPEITRNTTVNAPPGNTINHYFIATTLITPLLYH